MGFKEKVFYIVRKIPRASFLSYKEVAEKTGYPKAWRAVGDVLNKNQNPKVPCHRVIRNDRKIGGYKDGFKKKRALLLKEGVIIKNSKIVLYKLKTEK